jgi:hypothetical protein
MKLSSCSRGKETPLQKERIYHEISKKVKTRRYLGFDQKRPGNFTVSIEKKIFCYKCDYFTAMTAKPVLGPKPE